MLSRSWGFALLENRYLTLVFFFHVLPREVVFWHDPSWLGVDCTRHVGNASGVVDFVPPDGAGACPQVGCTPGHCNFKKQPLMAEPWRIGQQAKALAVILDTRRPDTLGARMRAWMQERCGTLLKLWQGRFMEATSGGPSGGRAMRSSLTSDPWVFQCAFLARASPRYRL